MELGAGCGNFGKIYFSPCCHTDKNKGLTFCHIDCFCDAYKLPFRENCFDMVIMCNPYGYGFYIKEDAEILLKELVRVLTDESKIIIIGNHANKFCVPKQVQKRIRQISLQSVRSLDFSVKDIDSKSLYPGYRFFTTDGRKTKPTKMVTLYVNKK